MRKYIIIFFGILLIIIIIGIIYACSYNYTNKINGTLLINNKKMITNNVYLIKSNRGLYAEIPLLDCLDYIGADISRFEENNDIIHIYLKGKSYVLSLNEKSLLEENINDNYRNTKFRFNLITPVPGNNGIYFCERKEDDIIIDSLTFHGILQLMDIKSIIDIDYDASTVLINIFE